MLGVSEQLARLSGVFLMCVFGAVVYEVPSVSGVSASTVCSVTFGKDRRNLLSLLCCCCCVLFMFSKDRVTVLIYLSIFIPHYARGSVSAYYAYYRQDEMFFI